MLAPIICIVPLWWFINHMGWQAWSRARYAIFISSSRPYSDWLEQRHQLLSAIQTERNQLKNKTKKKNAKCSGLSIAWIAPVLSFAPDRRFSTVFEIGCTDYAHMNHRVGHISISKCTPVKCTNWSLSAICILLFALPQRATQHKLNGPMHSKIDVARCAMSAQIGDRSSPASSIEPHARALLTIEPNWRHKIKHAPWVMHSIG